MELRDPPKFKVAVRLRSPKNRRISGVVRSDNWRTTLKALHESARISGGTVEGYSVTDAKTGDRVALCWTGA